MLIPTPSFAEQIAELQVKLKDGSLTNAAFKTEAETLYVAFFGEGTTDVQAIARMSTYLSETRTRDQEFHNWATGTVDGGPNGDGLYPITTENGASLSFPCIAKIMDPFVGSEAIAVAAAALAEQALAEIQAYDSAAAEAALAAQQAQTAAEAAQAASVVAKDASEAAKGISEDARDAAALSAAAALVSEQNADGSEAAALASENASNISELAAKASENAAKTSEDNAAASEGVASTKAAEASVSADAALGSENAAGASEAAAGVSEGNAATSAGAALASEQAATLSEANAADSEAAALVSKNAAGTSETNAAGSATAADLSKVAAEAARDLAEDHKDAAEAAKTDLELARDAAAVSAAAALTSEQNTTLSEAAALAAKVAAEAAEDGAEDQQELATTRAIAAETAEANAEDHKDIALGAKTAAELAADRAETALAQAEAITGIDPDALVLKSEVGQPNGVAELDANGKVPMSQLDTDLLGGLIYEGTWNAATNTPTIPAAVSSNKGRYYKVSLAGSTDIDGMTDWAVGDWLLSNGTAWDKIDNTDVVQSVQGRTGDIVITAADVGFGRVQSTPAPFSSRLTLKTNSDASVGGLNGSLTDIQLTRGAGATAFKVTTAGLGTLHSSTGVEFKVVTDADKSTHTEAVVAVNDLKWMTPAKTVRVRS